ncbi:acetyl-CoA synthetase-like protein [Lentinus tigrinus ALCF2SS1-6]|uniref:Acetyl-CoA synthetase-like protein n=1 Tax=Lentinus tigrinus ALCF2SS1-6 TaxID=1328759 RepID=A0A5C2SI80_9APHY|nr:acetyl-CoA synthetase-like protein [Lentinus tigrinus ALCF2SS1-6]
MTLFPNILTPQGVNVPTFSPPPLDGSMILPEWVPHHAKHSPRHPFVVYADENGENQTVYYPQVWRAVKNAKFQLSRQGIGRIPPSSDAPAQAQERPVIGILAVSDSLSCIALIWAIMGGGDIPFPISTRNSAMAVAHLLKQTGIRQLIVSSDPAMQRLAHEAIELCAADGVQVKTFPMPTFEDLYHKDEGFDFEIQKARLEDVAMILHSSGSTAFPKPIRLTHHRALEWATVPYYGELDMCGSRMASHALPLFHAMGIAGYKWALSSGLTVACFRPTLPPVIPTPDSLLDGIISCKCDAAFSVPSMIEASISQLSGVTSYGVQLYAGAPLSKAVGDKLARAGANLVPLYGSTEASIVSFGIYDRARGRRAPELWDWFHFTPRGKVHMVPYDDEERLYECVLLETPDNHPSVITTTIDGFPAFETKDLLQRHPEDPTLWCVYGRADDQLILSTGEKTNPGPLEAIMMQDPNILAVVMFGRGRLQNGVLVQPKQPFDPEDEDKLAEFRNKIWPTMERVNHYAPAHSRIFKELVLVTSPSKPFEFTAKGTPRRQACITAYSDEIDDVYRKMEESSQTDIAPPEEWTRESVQRYIRTIVDKVMSAPVRDDDDLFQNGCDSLQSTWIRNTILHGFRKSARLPTHDIPLTFVYSHPTIRELADYVYGLVTEKGSALEGQDALNARVTAMRKMVEKYKLYSAPSSETQAASNSDKKRSGEGRTVLLTGTTGRFGSHILAQLLQKPDVVKVYALNREKSGSDAALAARQREQFKLFGLDVGLLSSEKVVFCAAEFDKENLGLKEAQYRELCANVDTIIHNAWRVDFNLTLPSFEPLLAGVLNLLKLCQQTKQNGRAPHFAFISSISVFHGYSGSGLAPEAPIDDPRWAAGAGYSEGKWVAEQLVASASNVGIDGTVVRVGQLSGDTRIGGWSPQEWVPALVGVSQKIGCIPSRKENLTWLPVDTAAAALLETLEQDEASNSEHARTEYAHLVCPTPTPWDAVFGAYAKRLGLPLVLFKEWVQRLESFARSGTDAAARSQDAGAGLHLLEFFTKGLETGLEDKLSTEKTAARSQVLAAAKPVDETNVDRSLQYWETIDFLRINPQS